ncbi:hypothetical protein NLU13_6787 [Sarocladium strictum]|uniref:LYR motif-containing protein Cup1-like N-terminal domain-containing protein n=1 Tax=Sarocladium strictum TaxID=5046 RepID=A0AA39L6C4_SARSR|nr:hypothetical protein NLU13_6787 [Sarocladium strictum]
MAQARSHAEAVSRILSRPLRPRQPTKHTPLQTSILHTYRHILREITYLAPSIRENIRNPVVKRFKQHKVSGAHDARHIKRARQALRTLRAANAGDKKTYLSLIQKAFGRSWIRRYTLMDQNYLKKGPQDSEQLESILRSQVELDSVKAVAEAEQKIKKTPDLPPKRHGFQRWDLDKMMGAIQSQKKAQGNNAVPTWPRSSLGNLNPDSQVPEKNIWDKPPSEKLVLTKRAKWWDTKVSRVEPPLEKSEWDLLGRLAQGLQDTDDAWKLPRRRTPVLQLHKNEDERERPEWDWEHHLTRPISEVEKGKLPGRQLRSGERPSGPYGLTVEARTPTARWFRRAYEQTWMLTPYVEEDPKTSKLKYKWGGAPTRTKTPSALQMGIFEGVDDAGKPQKSSSP